MRERTNITPQQRMERRQQAKAKAKNYYQLQKYAALAYDYGQIAEAHRELVQEAALDIRKWQRNTIELGETLLAVKEVLEHGQFVEWMKVEFDSGLRVLQQAMNVARLLKDNPKAHDYALLSADALYLLAAPSTPDVVRWEIQERIELTDWRPTRIEIQRRIKAERTLLLKQLPAPKAHDRALLIEDAAIEAEYTVIQSDDGLIQLTLTPEMVEKLRLACLSRKSLREVMTNKEGDSGMLDRFFVLCQRALEAR